MVDLGRTYNISDAASPNFFPLDDDDCTNSVARIDYPEAFRADMMRNLGFAPKVIVGDGKIQRFPTKKNGRDDAGWCVLHDDEFPAGSYGDHRTGVVYKWRARETKDMSPAERERLEQVKAERERKAAAERAKAISEAQKRWINAKPADKDHSYLIKKGVKPHDIRQEGRHLLVPIYIGGKIASVQSIADDGSKRYQASAPVAGGYFIIESDDREIDDKLIIAEGFATGATLHEATGHPVVVAFNSGNLLLVAEKLREEYPAATIIIAADDDAGTELEKSSNPGLIAARKAAKAVGAAVTAPPFDRESDGYEPTDWNDFCALHGADAVMEAFGIPSSGSATGSTPDAPVSSTKSSGVNWPEPKPIESRLPAVKKLTPDMLPESIRDYVFDVADRQQSPVDFVAVAALSGLATLIGNKVRIKPKRYDDWLITPNIWAAIVGRPSAMKSPALKSAIAALYALQDELRKKWEEETRERSIDAELNDLDAKDAGKKAGAALRKGDREEARRILAECGGDDEEAPQEPRLVVNDTTVEKLGELLNQNPRGLILVRDELPGWLSKMQREEYQSERAFYLEAFDGDGQFTYDRIGRGTIHIENCTLSIVGGVQPTRIAPLVRSAMNGTNDDGLIQRLQLAVWPDDLKDWVWTDRKPDASAKAKYEAAFHDLHNLTVDIEDRIILCFSEEAQDMFREWMEEIQKEARGGGISPTLESHILKMPKAVCALALIFHLVDGGRDEDVGAVALARALEWADYLRSHADRLYAAGIVAADDGALLIIERRAQLPEKFTARDVERKHWAGLLDRETVDDAIAALIDAGCVRANKHVTSPGGGRPSTTYAWNPNLKAEG